MASSIKVSVDVTDLKILNDYLNTTEDKIDMTAKTAKKSFSQLKMAIDPAYRATKIFKDQVLVAQQAVATGAITQQEYSQTFAQIQKQASQAGITLNQFGQVISANQRKAKRFGAVGMQQVGYQVQDFAVQVQGGTSALVALGQQGSQLLGIFGPTGAIAGMILAIGTGLAGAFFAAKGAADSATAASVSYGDAMKGAKEKADELKLSNYMLANSIESVAKAQLKLAIIELQKQKEEDAEGGYGGVVQRRGIRSTTGVKIGETTLRKSADEKIADLKEQIRILDDLFSENEGLKLEVKTSENQEKAIELAKELKQANLDRAMTAIQSLNADAEALLILKQSNEAEKLRRKLKDENLDLTKGAAKEAIGALEIAHSAELSEFRRKAAIRERAEAERQSAADARAANAARIKQEKELRKLYKDHQTLLDGVGNSFEDAMVKLVDGTSSAKDAFRAMARDIITQLYRILLVQQLVGSYDYATGTGSGLSGFLGGMFRANGGPVTGGQPYVVGERGPELFVPKASGAIVSNEAMGAGGVSVVQNINISTGVQATVRNEIRSLMPQIADTAKTAVLDAKRRGGSYGRGFA